MAAPLQSRDAHEIMLASSYLGISTERMVTLDYGMGWAMWARIALRLGCQSFGTELAPERIAFAKEHGVEAISDDDIGVGQFDFINTEQVFEHLPEPRETAERLVAALRPGGILKISVPRADHADRLITILRADGLPTNDEFVPAQPLEHVNSFTARSLHVLAQRLGLEPVRPALLKRYAFLHWPGSVSVTKPRNSAKELIRPFYTYNNPKNLYLWMQKLS
jgi:SAM-dependent methyltransferase